MKLTKTLLCLGLWASATSVSARTPSASPATESQKGRDLATATLRKLTQGNAEKSNLFFLENRGQVRDQHGALRSDIDFKLETPGMNLFVGSGHMHYQWNKFDESSEQWEMYRMDVTLQGARKDVKPVTAQKHIYQERHFLPGARGGVVAQAWQKITYPGVYPGIDWVLYVKGSQVEYDFVIHPGAKASDVRLAYEGAKVRVNKDGSFTAETPLGTLKEDAPYSFLEDGTVVPSRFDLCGNILSFKTGAYTGKLTIDPVLSWSTMYGGSGADYGYDVVTDGEGNVYITGQTASVNNIATAGSHRSIRYGNGNSAYLVKFDSTGVRIWGTFFGDGSSGTSSGQCYGRSLACDPWNNIYLFGQTSMDHIYNSIATPGSHQDTISRNAAGTSISSDAFLTKFTSDGDQIWGTYYGGSGTEDGRSVACDKFGNVYICGYTNSPKSFKLATPGSHQDSLWGSNDGYLAKFDSSGVRLWGTYVGGSAADQFWDIAVDPTSEYVYMMGQSQSTSNIATAGAHQTAPAGSNDAVLIKFDSAGQRIWGTYFGGTAHDAGQSVSVDRAGNVYIFGLTQSIADIATPGAHQTTNNGSNDAFIAKFDSSGQRLWGTYFGGTAGEQPWKIHCDVFGNVFINGQTSSPTGIATPGSTQDTITYSNPTTASQDIFVSQFDTSGTLIWSTYYGGSGTDLGSSVTTDKYGHLYMCGSTLTGTTMFVTTPGAHQTVFGGGTHDGVLVRWDYCPKLDQPDAISGPDTLCVRESATADYSIPPVDGALFYEWILPQGWTGSSTTNQITVTVGTTGGLIEVKAHHICDTSDARTLYVQVFQKDTVYIEVSGSTLSASGNFASYQWYKESGIINGATNKTYNVTENDVYHVVVTDANGCVTTSEPYRVTNVSVQRLGSDAGDVHIFPNPVINRVHVLAGQPVQVHISSADGKALIQSRETAIDIAHLPAGVYLMSISDLEGRTLRVEKLIKTDR
jgi:hypothetical protein